MRTISITCTEEQHKILEQKLEDSGLTLEYTVLHPIWFIRNRDNYDADNALLIEKTYDTLKMMEQEYPTELENIAQICQIYNSHFLLNLINNIKAEDK